MPEASTAQLPQLLKLHETWSNGYQIYETEQSNAVECILSSIPFIGKSRDCQRNQVPVRLVAPERDGQRLT